MASKDEMSQGAKANNNGKIFEQQLIPLFKMNGYTVVKHSDYLKRSAEYESLERLVITSYPFMSIYRQKGKTEFLIVNRERHRVIRVECKWQQSSGSVDEKFPYMYLNCVYGYKDPEVVLIVDGGGYKPGARAWLEQAVRVRWLLSEDDPKSIRLMTISEFTAWFNRDLR